MYPIYSHLLVSSVLIFAKHIQCAQLCSYTFPVPQAHCDVSQQNVCCTNLPTDSCCNFDGQDGTNTHLGGSISFEGLTLDQQGQGYGPAIPGGVGTCSSFLTSIRGSGCVAFSQSRAASANYFNSPSKRLRDVQCTVPDKATYVDETGMPRHISIPKGNYSIIVQAMKDDDVKTLSQFSDFA